MGLGNCFEVAALYIIDHPDNDLTLVHGVVTGRGTSAGKIFVHAWIETPDGIFVIDNSNGKDRPIPKDFFYDLGNVGHTVKYDRKAAMKMMIETNIFGDWDDSFKGLTS